MKKIIEQYNADNNIIYFECCDRDIYKIETLLKQGFLSIFLFEKGNGSHRIGAEEYPIRKRQVHVVLPSQIHSLKFTEPTLFHLLVISKGICKEILGSIQIPRIVYQKYPIVSISKETFELLIRECRDIEFEMLEHSCVMQYIIYSKTKIILQTISREIRKTSGDLQVYDQHPVLFMFLVLIRKHFKEERSVSFYAGHLGITANYLNVLCKKHLKKTASVVIDLAIIPMIKEEIISSDDLLVNIAYDYSFQNYVHFSRYFKKYVGLSPTAYRKQL
ncbi:helix-turn-helix domain-containing protein [Chryseobacterium sp. NRRL B-14859]|uniref:AraC family transcriptional regulator n=1 Tax=unclassified Chryseobacterium TaxID=2593645 RepID=UPI000F453B7D|nr:helix-turn-helix domain-containing protein [Chryseobacterium sp. G0240]ROI05117.1 AraC family transcriptional regulator [Chryseobacterium sp. G0240]